MLNNTAETIKMLKNNVGYRNNEISAIIDPNIVEVFEFETNELMNDDIRIYMKTNYNLNNLEEIYTYFEKEFDKKRTSLYGFWLTSKEAVADLYSIEETEKHMDSYEINRFKTIIASDIGYDGTLFVSDHNSEEFLILT